MTEVTVPATTHHAKVVWEGGKGDLRAHRVEIAEQSFACSSATELGGDGSKVDPEAMLVAALSACHMLWFLDYARRERLRIASYEDDAQGEMDGTRFTSAVLRPAVGWQGEAPDAELERTLHERAHESCFIANSVNFPVEVEPR